MRLLDTIKSSSDYFEKAGIADPLVDAELLVLHAAGIDRLRAYIDNPVADRRLLLQINRLIKRRAGGEPLQYIIGYVDFLGLEIKVGKGVLIPRPETELLVEEAIKTVKRNALSVKSPEKNDSRFTIHHSQSFLDLCTGSGCIAIALAKEFPGAMVYGSDVSVKALKYAKGNADINGINNATFLHGPLFVPAKKRMPFDLITANPPYIMQSDIAGLQREVRDWEPAEALDGGKDGLHYYREILSSAAGYLKEHGSILFELGFGQSEVVKEIAERSGFKNITVVKDFAGIERVLQARK